MKVLSCTDYKSLEKELNALVVFKVHSVSVHPMRDYYDDGRICNQWNEYIAVVEVPNV